MARLKPWMQSVVIAAGLFSPGACLASPYLLQVDFGQTNGLIRQLHGLNKGPLVAGGIVDLTQSQRELASPLVRLHDCHWPNPDVVDIHAVFPNQEADPARPESYDFRATDEYIAAVQATGAAIVYRLGESIEHTAVKRFVHPPKDARKWAQVCLGIVRHYNEGWSNGKRLGIQYWEIWNEPENRPVMWTGTDDQFLELYITAARRLKTHDPTLKVGGPSFGYTGAFVQGHFRPSTFVTNFLARCRREAVPLDFFSWHCYTAEPAELVARSQAVRQLLDSFGFTAAESHLNEWNYLPRNSWTALSRQAPSGQRQQACDEMSGAAGAAFIAAALIELQDAPVDVCNLYHAEPGCFGMFSEQGVPWKNYHAVRAFREVAVAGKRAAVRGVVKGELAAIAGIVSSNTARILVSNHKHHASDYRLAVAYLPWAEATNTQISVRIVDPTQTFERVAFKARGAEVTFRLPAPGFALIELAEGRNSFKP